MLMISFQMKSICLRTRKFHCGQDFVQESEEAVDIPVVTCTVLGLEI